MSKSVFLFLSACVYVPDRWSPTAAACADALHHDLDPATASPACRAALAADFGVDPAGLSERDLRCLEGGLLDLLGREAGLVSDLEDGDFVRPPFRRQLQATARGLGTDDLRQAAYDLASVQVTGIYAAELPESDWRAAYDPPTGEILLRTPIAGACGVDLALVLFHEAMHGLAPAHVPCPDQPDDACDQSWSGAYGLQAGYADRLECDPVEEPEVCETILASRDFAAGRVLD